MSAIPRELAVIDSLKTRLSAYPNEISAAAFPLSQGRMEAGRDLERELNGWVGQYRGSLPDPVTKEMSGFLHRLAEWRSTGGRSDTPHALITDNSSSVVAITRALDAFETQLRQREGVRENATDAEAKIKLLKNKWWVVAILVAAGIVGTMLKLSLDMRSLLDRSGSGASIALVQGAVDLGWIDLGEYAEEKQAMNDAAAYKVIKTSFPASPHPVEGDEITLQVPKELVIRAFRTSGAQLLLEPPWRKGPTGPSDLSGVFLATGSTVKVTALSVEHRGASARIWVRVAL